MKNLIIVITFFIATTATASVNGLWLPAKVVSFDLKTVSLEIMGEKYNFLREKLGPAYKNLKAGETFELYIDGKSLKK